MEYNKKHYCLIFPETIWRQMRKLGLCTFTDEALESALTGNRIIGIGPVPGAGTVNMVVDCKFSIPETKPETNKKFALKMGYTGKKGRKRRAVY